MDLAETLIRSVTRAFYTTEHILVVDAILQHSAIRDDDLALLLSMQTKAARKLCAKLKEDGLIAIHSQQEQREGHNRAFTRDYYFVDMHRAIDATKYRLKGMTAELERKHGQKVEEVMALACPRCKMQYTNEDIVGAEFSLEEANFLCKRCGHVLDNIDEESSGSTVRHTGHEQMSKLNSQLAPFEDLMRLIDAAEVPENDWDNANAHRIPIRRDQTLNPGARSVVVDSRPVQKTVHGLKQEVEAAQVIIEGADTPEERERKAKERLRQKEEEAKKNALPVWYTNSTVGAGEASAAAASSTANGAASSSATTEVKKADDDEDSKTGVAGAAITSADDDALKAYYAAMEEAEDEEEDSDEEDDDDDDDDDSDDGSEDGSSKATPKELATPSNDAATSASGESPRKRVRIESPKKDEVAEAIANGGEHTSDDDSD